MYGKLKQQLRGFFYSIVDDVLCDHASVQQKSHPATKVALRSLFNFYQAQVRTGNPLSLAETGCRVFSQFEEDGMLLYIFAAIGAGRRLFVDIGAADGVNSNCANLAIHFGWTGLLVEGNAQKVARATRFYSSHPDTFLCPPRVVQAFVHRDNINDLLIREGIRGPIDLLSIDIDGNDYWVWEALEAIDPRVVIVETNTVFGTRSIVVPYDKEHRRNPSNPDYAGASPAAMAKLAQRKGYRLVGANYGGTNSIYVKNGIGEEHLPEVSVDSILCHPRQQARRALFESMKDLPFETID